MWQTELNAATLTYREFLVSLTATATSKHCSAIVVNAGGSGHAIGDIITIGHASAYHPARVEVLTVSTGAITSVRIHTGGAYAERVASAVVGAAAGSGYAIGDIVEVQDGAGVSSCKAKFEVATLSGSAIATVTLFEDGGAYSTTPTTNEAATIGIGPDGHAGDDVATLDLTMQSIVGTTGIAQTATTGSGISATFDLTLTDTGWTVLYSKNDSTIGLAADDAEKDVVLQGTVAGGDSPIIGFVSFKQESGAEDRYGLGMFGMTAFNPGLALANQPNVGPLAWTISNNNGAQLLITEEVAEGNSWWMSITPRRICGVVRGNVATESDNYHSFYIGLMNQYGAATTNPYPMMVAGSSTTANQATSDLNHTGLCEAYQPAVAHSGPIWYMQKSDLSWNQVLNGVTTSVQFDKVMWPMGQAAANTDGANQLAVVDNYRRMASGGGFSSSIRSNLSVKHFPAPGSNDEFVLMPLTVIQSGASGTNNTETTIPGELDGCFWPGGTKADGSIFTAEDTIENAAGDRYFCFPVNTETLTSRRYQFMCFRQD